MSRGREDGKIPTSQASHTRKEDHKQNVLSSVHRVPSRTVTADKQQTTDSYKDFGELTDGNCLGQCQLLIDTKLAVIVIDIICDPI